MISVKRFEIKEEYKELYTEYQEQHKIYFVNDAKRIAIFTNNYIDFRKKEIPLEHIELSDEYFEGNCVYRANHVISNGRKRNKVKVLMNAKEFKKMLRVKDRNFDYLYSLQDIYGQLVKINTLEYKWGYSHAYVAATFVQLTEEDSK